MGTGTFTDSVWAPEAVSQEPSTRQDTRAPTQALSPRGTAEGQDTHRALTFHENSLRQKSPSWNGSKVDGSRRLAWALECAGGPGRSSGQGARPCGSPAAQSRAGSGPSELEDGSSKVWSYTLIWRWMILNTGLGTRKPRVLLRKCPCPPAGVFGHFQCQAPCEALTLLMPRWSTPCPLPG